MTSSLCLVHVASRVSIHNSEGSSLFGLFAYKLAKEVYFFFKERLMHICSSFHLFRVLLESTQLQL